jgi:DNA-binding response OmpR family regulator
MSSASADDAEVVAVINTNDDLVNLLSDELMRAGFSVVTLHIRDIKAGRQNFATFLKSHDPAIVVYDITVPYEDSWTFFEMLRRLPEAANRQFVVTTVNKRVFEQRVGLSEVETGDVIEIQGGHADDLDPLLDRVKQLSRSGAGRSR